MPNKLTSKRVKPMLWQNSLTTQKKNTIRRNERN